MNNAISTPRIGIAAPDPTGAAPSPVSQTVWRRTWSFDPTRDGPAFPILCYQAGCGGAGPTPRTQNDFNQARLEGKKQLIARGRDGANYPRSWCCCLALVLPVACGLALFITAIATACPRPHQTPTGEKVVIEDLEPTVVLIPTVLDDEFVLATPEQYQLRDFITDQTKARYPNLSLESCEYFANQCSRFDEPLKWCARGWAESSANTEAVNKSSGCRGFFQVHPCHKKRMASLGLDFYSEGDRVSFCQVIGAKSDGPWAESNGKMRKWWRQLEAAWAETKQ